MSEKQKFAEVGKLRRLAGVAAAMMLSSSLIISVNNRPAAADTGPTPTSASPADTTQPRRDPSLEPNRYPPKVMLALMNQMQETAKLMEGAAPLITETRIGKDLFLSVRDGFDGDVGTSSRPGTKPIDVLANGAHPPEIKLFTDLNFSEFHHGSPLEAIVLPAPNSKDNLSVIKVNDEQKFNIPNMPIAQIADSEPVPGQEYTLVGYPDATRDKEAYVLTYYGSVNTAELSGNPPDPNQPTLMVLGFNGDGPQPGTDDAMCTHGESGSSIKSVTDQKIYGVYIGHFPPVTDPNSFIAKRFGDQVMNGRNICLAEQVTNSNIYPYIAAIGQPEGQ